MPTTSKTQARRGRATSPATSVGTTRYRIGLSAITVSASICSVIRMTPISAASADPARPVTMSAASTGPSSRTSAIATNGPTKASDPTRCSISMPWSPRTIPVNAPVRRMTDIERRPTNQIRWSAWRALNGGTTAHRSASARNTPKRPRAERVSRPKRPRPWTEPRTSEPTISTGRVCRGAPAGLPREPAPHPEGPQRKVVGVEVVLQVEDPREAGSVPERVPPTAVGALSPEQELDAALDRGGVRPSRSHQAEQGPSGLTGSRHPASLEPDLRVGVAGLAPASVRVLAGLEPLNGAFDHWIVGTDPNSLESPQNRPGPVEIV